MAKKKVFVSFDYDNDKKYKYLLQAWDKNPEFDFSFNDQSSGEINSDNISRIKAALTRKISNSTYVLVIVGQHSNSKHPDSDKIRYKNWQNWEVAKAKELRKKIVGIKIDSSFSSPDELLSSGASWAYKFNEQSIISALKKA